MEPENLAEGLSDQDRLLLVFGYLGPLALVSLVASRRELVKWHAKQGLVFSAALVGLYIVLKLIYSFVDRFFWAFFAELFWAGSSAVALGAVLVMLVCIVRGLAGERFRIPMIGDLTDKL